MSKCWYCNEEITTGNNPEHLGFCDKCYDEMFKTGNDFIEMFTSRIADLEAKLAKADQDKISFCIEKLEKVKEKVREPVNCWLVNRNKDLDEIEEDIDNQIEELKKGE